MEIVYEKGSLSELITGKKVKNKEKVVIRYAKIDTEPKKHVDDSKNTEILQDKETNTVKSSNPPTKKPKKKDKKKRSKERCTDNITNEENVPNIEDTAVQDKMKATKNNITLEQNEESQSEIKDDDLPSDNITSSKNKKGNRKEKKEKAKQFKAFQQKKEELNNNPEELARTIFVGNVPLTTTKINFKKFFTKYGKVESVRFRCPPIKNINTSKKVCVIKGEYHPERSSWISYVKFQTEEDAKKAQEANGEIYNDHHLRVSLCKQEEKHDESRAVFIGNLALNAEDDQLWQAFESCGKIESVRIVRDKNSGIGKGFAFINFASSDSVQLALEMDDIKVNKKIIRVQPCNMKAAKKNKMNSFAKVIKPNKPKKERKIRNENDNSTKKRKREDEDNIEGRNSKIFKKSQGENISLQVKKSKKNESNKSDNLFEGTKIAIKKKKKKDKGLLKKQKLAKKLIAKPK